MCVVARVNTAHLLLRNGAHGVCTQEEGGSGVLGCSLELVVMRAS